MTYVCTFYLCDAANIVDIHFCILWLVLYHFVFIGLVGIILDCVIIASLVLYYYFVFIGLVGIILGSRVAQHEAATMALFHPFYHKPTKGVAHCWGG